MDAQGTENKRGTKDERETRRGRRNRSDADGGGGKPVFFVFQSFETRLSNLSHMITMIKASKHRSRRRSYTTKLKDSSTYFEHFRTCLEIEALHLLRTFRDQPSLVVARIDKLGHRGQETTCEHFKYSNTSPRSYYCLAMSTRKPSGVVETPR